MLKIKRLDQMLSYVNESGYASVDALSEQLSVSKETVRRDLKYLDGKNLIIREYGGARRKHEVQTTSNGSDIAKSFYIRASENQDKKTRIAKKALSQIKENDCIFLDNSSTSWFLAKQIPDINITIITNSLEVINGLACRSNIRIIGIGGEYSVRHNDFNGVLAEQAIKSFRANKLFFSCDSFSVKSGIRDGSENNAQLKQVMASISDCTILMADSTKFGKSSLCGICNLDEVDFIISDINDLDRKTIESECANLKIIQA